MRFDGEPAFPVRGYMLDVSRDRVPTRDTLDRLVGLLELARYNHLELYVEHTFAFEGHERVWADASPLTGDDLAWLDDRCGAAGIELVANQNTFGHMERWLKHPEYRHRALSADGYDFMGHHRPAATLAPTRDNADFALGLVRAQLAHVRSRTVNVGCDETFELGDDRSDEYFEHLLRIAQPLIDDGCHVLFWGDIIANHPELIHRLPAEGMTALVWNYEAPRKNRFRFDEAVKPFADAGFPYWVCPGTSSWNSLIGRIDNATANLLDAARTGAAGYLVTDWGDNGHMQPPSVSFGPIVYGGAVAWDPVGNADIDLPAALDTYVFEDEAGVLGTCVDRLGRVWNRTGKRSVNGSPLQAALFPQQLHFTWGEPDPAATQRVIDEIDDVLALLRTARPRCVDGDLVIRELTVAARLARQGALRLLGQEETDGSDVVAAYERVWLARSRPGGLADSRAWLRTR